MAISRRRIATISEWKSNCVVAVNGDYIGELLRSNQLSADQVAKLLAEFQDYYKVPALTHADLMVLLTNRKYFPTPNHSQEILGCVLRHYLEKSSKDKNIALAPAGDRQLTIAAFDSIAAWLGFGVKFYMPELAKNPADEALIKEMPELAINRDSPLLLEVVWHNCVDVKASKSQAKNDFHFDRLMPTVELAEKHDAPMLAQIASAATLDRPLQRDDEAAMKQEIRDAIADIRMLDEEKHQESRINKPYAPPRRPVITPAFSLSLQHATEEKKTDDDQTAVVTNTVKQSWEDFVNQEIKDLKSTGTQVKIVDLAVATKTISAGEFQGPKKDRKILYSLWGNKVAIVDAKTQEKWDQELAERLGQEEEKAASCVKRP